MAEVVLDVAGHDVVAEISRGPLSRLELEEGDAVTAIVESTEVIIGK
jgi:molybdopterin-binding protein